MIVLIVMTTIHDMEIQILLTYDNVFQLFISKKEPADFSVSG